MPENYRKKAIFSFRNLSSNVGGGRNAETSPQKQEKLLQKTGLIFPGYILSEKGQKSKKSLVKTWGKVDFPLRFVSKNLKIFLMIFKILFIFGPKSESFVDIFLKFSCIVEFIPQKSIILKSSTNYSRFSQKFSKHFIPFQQLFWD